MPNHCSAFTYQVACEQPTNQKNEHERTPWALSYTWRNEHQAQHKCFFFPSFSLAQVSFSCSVPCCLNRKCICIRKCAGLKQSNFQKSIISHVMSVSTCTKQNIMLHLPQETHAVTLILLFS